MSAGVYLANKSFCSAAKWKNRHSGALEGLRNSLNELDGHLELIDHFGVIVRLSLWCLIRFSFLRISMENFFLLANNFFGALISDLISSVCNAN